MRADKILKSHRKSKRVRIQLPRPIESMTCCVFFGLNLPKRSQLGRGRGILVTGRKTAILARQALLRGLAFYFAIAVLCQTAAANPAQMISDFRLKHGEKRV